MSDYINRDDVIDLLEQVLNAEEFFDSDNAKAQSDLALWFEERIAELPKAERSKNMKLYNIHEVACILAELFGDTCACNYNDIDEWLPSKCDFADNECPNVVGVACWEQYLEHREENEHE